MSKTILLTGGTGYIGSHTAVALIQKGYDVVIVDNLTNSKIEVLNRIHAITDTTPVFYHVDLCNLNSLAEVFEQNKIDAVIHFAGNKSVGESVIDPITTYYNNLFSSVNLIKAMTLHNVKNLIFSSSATVYSNAQEFPIIETTPTSADSPYGRSKKMIEDILFDLHKSDNSWNISILRYFNPVGAHPSGLIGEDPKGTITNLFPILTDVALGKRENLDVYGNDYETSDGTCIRDYIHVVDLVNGHLAALDYMDKVHDIDVFNLGTGIGYSVLDAIKCFETVSGKKIPYKFKERRMGDIPISYADPQKANRLLNWKTELSLEDMCKDAWNWQVRNPEGYNTY